MRWATLLVWTLVACHDLRDFRGSWEGARVAAPAVLAVGAGDRATLVIDRIETHGLEARLAIDGLLPEVAFASLPGAEADALANLTFAGAPLRVFLAFVPVPDGGGDALVVTALYDDARVELRVLRGGITPLYAIYRLGETP